MRIQRLATMLFLSGFLAASAVAFEIKPGEWEMEISGNLPGAAMQKQKICISPEQAKSTYRPENMAARDIPKDCKVSYGGEKGGVTSYEVSCDMQGMKMDTKGTVKKVSDNEILTEAATTMTPSGQKSAQAMKMQTKASVKKISDSEIVMNTTMTSATMGTTQMTMKQKYLGPNCSKDAKPMQGGAKPG